MARMLSARGVGGFRSEPSLQWSGNRRNCDRMYAQTFPNRRRALDVMSARSIGIGETCMRVSGDDGDAATTHPRRTP